MGLKDLFHISPHLPRVLLKSDQDGIERFQKGRFSPSGFTLLKSDQDGIERYLSLCELSLCKWLKSDQDGIESNIWEGLATSLLMLKSDQDGIER